MTSFIQTNQFTTRTVQIVGRKAELQFIDECLHDKQCSHFIYYYGKGGIGKTRILEEVLGMIGVSPDTFPTSRILDLYHTETHDPNDIEHLIVSRLDSRQVDFQKYFETWEWFQRLVQRGGSPDQIKETREQLTRRFIEGANALAGKVDKIVLLFDTLEQIQLDSSIVEEKIGMMNIDPRIRNWILKVLPQLSNVLVIFAGRPKQRMFGETQDPQSRLLSDMQAAFGSQFRPIELPPLNLEEASGLIARLSEWAGKNVIAQEDLPLISKITGGKPILLHLIFDLFHGLSEQPSVEMELLKSYASLVTEPDDSPKLAKAQAEFEQKITRSIYENTGMTGEYLSRMALMPKGVDQEILVQILGLPETESLEFLNTARKLSFIKMYAPANPGDHERIFLHDEMYRLINNTLKRFSMRTNERMIARNLIDGYYQPKIIQIKQELEDVNRKIKNLTERVSNPSKNTEPWDAILEDEVEKPVQKEPERIDFNPAQDVEGLAKKYAEESYNLKNQLHKLQIDKFYYQIAQDPAEGYKFYKRLSYQSAMSRDYGYDVPLLDEFLRFYNSEDHRDWFKNVGIGYEQVVRESALLWIERFHWCADYLIETKFARAIGENPKVLFIDPEKNISLLANIYALADRAEVMLGGFNQNIVDKDNELLAKLQAIKPESEDDLIALARLCTTIGYTYRCGGQFKEAIEINQIGLDAMRDLKNQLALKANHDPKTNIDFNIYLGEEIILKNNMAFSLAKQGQFMEANIMIRDAYHLGQDQPGLVYSQGLSLTIMASIERLQGKHHEAMKHGGEAYNIFIDMGDHHGLVRALLNIGSAYRQIGEQDRARENYGVALQEQLKAKLFLEKALKIAQDGKLIDQAVGMQAELGKIHRGIGKILIADGKPREIYIPYLQKGVDYFNETLKSPRWIVAERADIYEDLAELKYVMGDSAAALAAADVVEKEIIGHQPHLARGLSVPAHISGWNSLPLGKTEGLRFKIAMDKAQYQKGLEYFILAYVYYYRHSVRAHQIQHLIETFYDRYWAVMSYDVRKKWLDDMDNLLIKYGDEIAGVDVKELVDRMKKINP